MATKFQYCNLSNLGSLEYTFSSYFVQCQCVRINLRVLGSEILKKPTLEKRGSASAYTTNMLCSCFSGAEKTHTCNAFFLQHNVVCMRRTKLWEP